jgi:hypothetical protein
MSFLRHWEIYPSDGNAGIGADVPAHRLDEFPVGYSSASCTPALLAFASPTGPDYAVMLSYWSTVFQRPANSVLSGCLSSGGKRRKDEQQTIGGRWFPVSVDLNCTPPLIHWMRLDGVEFTEPMFVQTISRVTQNSKPSVYRTEPLQSLMDQAAKVPATQPAAFIFHISRCGSTLISNALKPGKNVTVISEPDAVSALLLLRTRHFGSLLPDLSDDIWRTLNGAPLPMSYAPGMI